MPRVLIMGVGGIGGTIAAHLCRAHPTTHIVCCTPNAAVRTTVAQDGLKVVGLGGPFSVPVQIVADPPPDGSFDYVFVATQPPEMEQAVRSIVHLLQSSSKVLCFQNGLPEAHLARVVGQSRVVSAVVGWGASSPQIGVFERTSAGGFTMKAPVDPELVALLESIGPVHQTPNLMGARWSKLAFNCAISTLGTIGGDTLGALIRRRFVRRMTLEIFEEVVTVAHAEGIHLEKLAGTIELGWLGVKHGARPSPALMGKHALLLGVGMRYRRLRSSMLAALERGRMPAVDFLNGEVVARGEQHGIPTPVNRAALNCVHRIHRGEINSSLASLRGVYEQTR